MDRRSFVGLLATAASFPTTLFELCRGLGVALRAEAERATANLLDPVHLVERLVQNWRQCFGIGAIRLDGVRAPHRHAARFETIQVL
jgi:hypothetical protein